MDIHYYFLCYRQDALVASHLSPEAFGRYMAVGSEKLTHGIVIFFEVTPPAGSPWFRLDDIAARCAPHADGSPKRSKYVSVYRVLEHLPLSSFGWLYLTTADGRVLGVDAAEQLGPDEAGMNLYQELCPLSPRVGSTLGPRAFVRFMTSADQPLAVPRIFFADLRVERDANGRLAGDLPYPHPRHIEACLRDLERHTKPTKTLARVPQIDAFFRTIRRGFYLGDATGVLRYPFPSLASLEGEHHVWWRSAQAS